MNNIRSGWAMQWTGAVIAMSQWAGRTAHVTHRSGASLLPLTATRNKSKYPVTELRPHSTYSKKKNYTNQATNRNSTLSNLWKSLRYPSHQIQ